MTTRSHTVPARTWPRSGHLQRAHPVRTRTRDVRWLSCARRSSSSGGAAGRSPRARRQHAARKVGEGRGRRGRLVILADTCKSIGYRHAPPCWHASPASAPTPVPRANAPWPAPARRSRTTRVLPSSPRADVAMLMGPPRSPRPTSRSRLAAALGEDLREEQQRRRVRALQARMRRWSTRPERRRSGAASGITTAWHLMSFGRHARRWRSSTTRSIAARHRLAGLAANIGIRRAIWSIGDTTPPQHLRSPTPPRSRRAAGRAAPFGRPADIRCRIALRRATSVRVGRARRALGFLRAAAVRPGCATTSCQRPCAPMAATAFDEALACSGALEGAPMPRLSRSTPGLPLDPSCSDGKPARRLGRAPGVALADVLRRLRGLECASVLPLLAGVRRAPLRAGVARLTSTDSVRTTIRMRGRRAARGRPAELALDGNDQRASPFARSAERGPLRRGPGQRPGQASGGPRVLAFCRARPRRVGSMRSPSSLWPGGGAKDARRRFDVAAARLRRLLGSDPASPSAIDASVSIGSGLRWTRARCWSSARGRGRAKRRGPAWRRARAALDALSRSILPRQPRELALAARQRIRQRVAALLRAPRARARTASERDEWVLRATAPIRTSRA